MARTSSTRKIQATKNYRLFERSMENRPLDMKKHRKLEQSMKAYGFLPCFPIVCCRNGDKHLIVKDGQHRLAVAETLGLPVHWTEEAIDFDVAVVNSTAKTWVLADYAQKHAANGKKAYKDGLEFVQIHGLPVGTAFSLLGGVTSFSAVSSRFIDGTFVIKDRQWADSVAGIYGPLVQFCPAMKNARFVEACMYVCRVDGFDPKRLLHNAERCREKLVAYRTRDAYLDMLEEVYNFGRAKLVGLKAEATMAMRNRNPAKQAKKTG